MDYTGYRFRAVVDWLSFEIHTITPTQFQHVQTTLTGAGILAAGVIPFVKALDAGAGNNATRFDVRIQDPGNVRDLLALVDAIQARHPLRAEPTITAIEIALDAYGSMPEQVARFYKFAEMVWGNSPNHRLFQGFKGSGLAIPLHFDSLVRLVAGGYNIAIGNKDNEPSKGITADDIYIHAYWKTTDGMSDEIDPQTGRKKATPLPLSEHRARYEVRLQGEALPCQTLSEWEAFGFESLARRYFSFREFKQVTADDTSTQATTHAAMRGTMQIGARWSRSRRGGGTRLHSKLTQADKVLNARARDALRELSRRWRCSPRR